MNFAKKELEKYGWKEGKGLGKDEDGICKPVTPSLKFDSCGVGYDYGQEYTTNWWEQLYNTSANSISVNIPTNEGIVISLAEPEDKKVATKNIIQSVACETYSCSFIKSSTLTGSEVNHFENTSKKIRIPTDEELLSACEGRTGHKAARHGLKLTGKLSRIEKQEKLLLKQLKKISLNDNDDTSADSNKSIEKKLKKLDLVKKCKKKSSEKDSAKSKSTYNPFAVTGTPKRNKKEKKRVSFNETVTEYQTHDVNNMLNDSGSQSDASSRPSTPLMIKVKEKSETKEAFKVDLDEGIDCSDSILIKVKPINGVPKKSQKDKLNKHLKKIRNSDGIKPRMNSDNPELLVDEIEKNKKLLKRKGKQEADGDLKKVNKKYRTCGEIEVKHAQSKQQKPIMIVNQQISVLKPQVTIVNEQVTFESCQAVAITNQQQLSVATQRGCVTNRPYSLTSVQCCPLNRQHGFINNCHYSLPSASRRHCISNRSHCIVNRQHCVASRQRCIFNWSRPTINRKEVTVVKQVTPVAKQKQTPLVSDAKLSITKNEDPLNNRINKIADILTDYCKISDAESA